MGAISVPLPTTPKKKYGAARSNTARSGSGTARSGTRGLLEAVKSLLEALRRYFTSYKHKININNTIRI